MCSGSEAGSYLRLIDCVYHSTLGLRVIKKKKFNFEGSGLRAPGAGQGSGVDDLEFGSRVPELGVRV